MTLKPQMSDYADTSFTDIIYTKLSTFPSRKISGFEWVFILDVVVFKAPYRPFKQRTRLEGHHILELAKKVTLPTSCKNVGILR